MVVKALIDLSSICEPSEDDFNSDVDSLFLEVSFKIVLVHILFLAIFYFLVPLISAHAAAKASTEAAASSEAAAPGSSGCRRLIR